MHRIASVFTLIVILLFVSCSQAKTSDPVTPSVLNQDRQVIASGTVEFDPVSMTVKPINDRESSLHYNVTSLLGGACPGGCFKWSITSVVGELWTLKLTLENPTSLQVYDARIVFTQLGGKTLENRDGLTDVFAAGQMRPFLAFAKTLPNRAFPVGPGGKNEIPMLMRWPAGASVLVTYFIEVSIGGNCKEPYQIHDQRQDGTLTPISGSAKVHVEVSDHQNDANQVLVDTTVLTGSMTLLDFVSGEVWEKEISNSMGAPVGEYPSLIRASSPGETVKLYDYVTLVVSEAPNFAWTAFGGNMRNSGATSVIGPQTNHIAWYNNHQITGDYHTIGAPVIDSEGDVYYHVTPNPYDCSFYKVSGVDGSNMWSHNPDADEPTSNKEVYGVPALNEEAGYVYYACLGGLWAVNMSNGSHVGHYLTTNLNSGSSPNVGPEYVYFGYPSDYMRALTPNLSAVQYSYTSGAGFNCTPAIDSNGNAYFPELGTARKLHGINLSGAELFTPPTVDSEARRLVSAALDEEGVIYYQSAGYKLYAFNPNGSIKWNYFSSIPNSYYTSPVIGHGRNIYIFREKVLYAIDKVTGDEDWSVIINKNCITPACDGHDTLYFLTTDGYVNAFDTNTKTMKWTYNTSRPLYDVPAYRYPSACAIGPDGLLAVMGNAGVWAFRDL